MVSMLENKKDGQVTLFIIIAVVIVIIIFLSFMLIRNRQELSQEEAMKIRRYIDDCLMLETQKGIVFIAKQGGYFDLPRESISFLDEMAPYYWKNNLSLIPSIKTVETELSKWLYQNYDKCFKNDNYIISITDKEACNITFIISNEVKGNVYCPIIIKKGAATTTIQDFSFNVPIPIHKFLDISDRLVLAYQQTSGYFCLDCIDELASNNNVTIRIVPISQELAQPPHLWFLITDNTFKFNERNITWRFVTDL